MSKKPLNNKWPNWLSNSLKELAPPEKIKVSEWAERYRILDSKSSARPGPWRNDVTPYLNEIMDEFNNPDTTEIIFVKPTQVGGTEVLLNAMGYFITHNPQPMMIVYPSQDLAEHVSKNRIRPTIKLSKALRQQFKEEKSEIRELQFENMYVALEGANSPGGLSSKPIGYLLLDEVDKYPTASKKEADPIKLARERTKTFIDSKIFILSTPTLRTGQIWRAKEGADAVKKYEVPCPHCSEYIELKMSQLKWPSRDEYLHNADRAKKAFYVCNECGQKIYDKDKPKMLREGRWFISEKKAEVPMKVAYWMNTLYSPFVRFSEVAKEFLDSKDDPDQHQNFVNSWLAEPWEDTKLKTNADMVMARQTEDERLVVPQWAEFLTAGVDVQETSVYWTIRAWGKHLTSQKIASGQSLGFSDVEKIMNAEFLKKDGQKLIVALAGIDSGDQTDTVYQFCKKNSEWAMPVKGVGGGNNHFRISTVDKAGSEANGMQLLLVDGGKYKDMIASRMKKSNGQGSWMVHKGCSKDYAEQVTAEHKIKEKGQLKWVPKTSHADNHYLDCEVYAFAVADVLGVRELGLDVIEEEPTPDITESINQEATTFNENNWLKGTSGWL